jgi:hypothetical protein
MSGHEGEKTTTLTGLKRSEVLRQTEDGAFEFIVDEVEEDGVGPTAPMFDEGPEPAVRMLRPWRKRLLIAAPVAAVVLIGTGVALTRDSNSPQTSREAAQVILDEVPGFRPYGGGEAVPRQAARRPNPKPVAPVPVREFDDEIYEDEFVDESDQRDSRWSLGNESGTVVVEELDPGDLDPGVREEPSDSFRDRAAMLTRERPKDFSERVTRPELMKQLQGQNLGREGLDFHPGARIPPQIRETMLQRDLHRSVPGEQAEDDYVVTDPTGGENVPGAIEEEEFDPDWEENEDDNF